MEQRKRILIFLTFFVCTACLAMLTACLATHKWIVAHPLRPIALNSSSFLFDQQRDVEHNEVRGKFRGEVYFGLFQGTKVLNYGLGDRTTVIWMKQEMSRNPSLMSFSLWLFTILAVSVAMIFCLVGAIFAIINTVTTPVERITGVQGLHLWNGLACLFCVCANVAWLVQFAMRLNKNVLTEEEQHDGWTSSGRARLGYSFYFVMVSGLLHLCNVALLLCATRSPRRSNRPVVDKHPEGLIMLY